MKLQSYGKKTKIYIPFEQDELARLFAQEMKSDERLILSVLVTTGMRLDEVCLLNWSQFKEQDGIRYFDLRDSDLVKNEGSKRQIPLPDCLNIAKGHGDLFNFTKDKDGKAATAASKKLMTIVRKVTGNKQKVIHSLRGNLKDMLRDSGVTQETNNFITGHQSGGVAGKYGVGPSLKVKYEAVNSVDHSKWLKQ